MFDTTLDFSFVLCQGALASYLVCNRLFVITGNYSCIAGRNWEDNELTTHCEVIVG